MPPQYQKLVDKLAARGVRSYFQNPHQLVLSRQTGPVWPEPGNSFWIFNVTGTWYVATWTPRYYRLRDESKMADFCAAFVGVGAAAQYEVPLKLIQQYNVEEVSDDVFDKLYG